MKKIKEDGEGSVPTSTMDGIVGPVTPMKIQNVTNAIIRRGAKLKTKKAVSEELHIIADVLLCKDSGTAVFLS